MIKERGLSPEEVATRMGVSVFSIFKYYKKDDFNTSVLEQLAEILNVDISYFFGSEEQNKIAIGHQAIAGSGNTITGNVYVTLPQVVSAKIISVDGSIRQVDAINPGVEGSAGLAQELEERKQEIIQLQNRIIELQDLIISSQGGS
ncbi:MAG: helix-turn-helix transcriptional regulator [Tannerellaceae bacterium]|nr:helix-turn-helix transcriptional regulator [Tannerellaceae bacterium]